VPEPIVAHVVGTVALLGAAVLVVAAITAAYQLYYMQTLNLMLAEVAESCARELVELVSVHTLGGSGVTYMALTVPSSLAGQPYNLSIVSRGDNVIEVRAQLQLYRQVRVVVTPNFGRGPVYAVPGTVRLGDLELSNYILIPTPQGWRAMLVAVNQGDAVLVGFATQLGPLERPGSPSFKLVGWAQQVSGLAGSERLFTFAVWNRGSAGRALVKVLNETGATLGSVELTVGSGEVVRGAIPLKLPGAPGAYIWMVECWNLVNGTLDDAQSLSVEVLRLSAVFAESISGLPNSEVPFEVVLINEDGTDWTAHVQFVDREASCAATVPAGGNSTCTLLIKLPSNPGQYTWKLRVEVPETGYKEDYDVYIHVKRLDAALRIAELNRSVVGAVDQWVRLVVVVNNTWSSDVNASLLVVDSSGATVAAWSGVVGASSTLPIDLAARLPSLKGEYTWYVRAYRQDSGEPEDEELVRVEARDVVLVRTAFYVEGFDSPPSGWHPRGGEWLVTSGGWSGGALQGRDDDNGPGGSLGKGGRRYVSAYYWAQNIWNYVDPVSGFSAVAKLYFGSGDSNVYRGFALLDSGLSKLYEVSVFRLGQSASLFLWKLEGGWGVLAKSSEVGCREGWYTLYVSFSLSSTANLVGELYDSSGRQLASVSWSTSASFEPVHLALMVDEKVGVFDELVVASGDARYVVVKGLPQGWRAELYLGGSLVASATADSSGTAWLLTAHYPVLRGATLVLKDSGGGQALSRAFELIVGGDVFEFTSR